METSEAEVSFGPHLDKPAQLVHTCVYFLADNGPMELSMVLLSDMVLSSGCDVRDGCRASLHA